MPYIGQTWRKELKKRSPINAGEINYLFTLSYIKSSKLKSEIKRRQFVKTEMLKIVKSYLKAKENNYQTFNDIAGAITLSLAEFARRKGLQDKQTNIWYTALIAGADVQDWLNLKHINKYEDAKISENGDVY